MQKDLECVYDLEPLNGLPTEPERVVKYEFDSLSIHLVGVCIIKTLKGRAPNLDPALCPPGQASALAIIKLGFDTVPDLLRAGRPGLFVHPQIKLPGATNHFSTLVEDQARGVGCESFKRLIQILIKSVSPREALTALQALLVHLAASIFSPLPAERNEADRFLETLADWTQTMLACVDAGMPRGHSSWQDWLLAESKSIPYIRDAFYLE